MTVSREDFRTGSGVRLEAEAHLGGDDEVDVSVAMEEERPCVLHWGVVPNMGAAWRLPPISAWPEGSRAVGDSAVQTPLGRSEGRAAVCFRLSTKGLRSPHVAFVLFYPGENRWDNNHGRNYHLRLPVHDAQQPTATHLPPAPAAIHAVVEDIVAAETGRNSWTLMHRFNLCFELLDKVAGNRDGLAWLFVWLRFSAIRQLDWQRNYNTKPRELSHAMDRLTGKLADLHSAGAGDRGLLRLLFTTLGRGAEGQRIRDEILEIMHRHHLKEATGSFMEEWHQKMHNNTTPDDIVICEAYLDFLRRHGDLGVFYSRLEAGGVSRHRLQSYERPIRTDPDFPPHLRDGLIRDFTHFLETLEAVHAGVDFEASFRAVAGSLDEALRSLLHFIRDHRNDSTHTLVERASKITEARRRLASDLERGHRYRDLLFLDLSLETLLRNLVEGSLHTEIMLEELGDLIALVLENMLLGVPGEEYEQVLRHWRSLHRGWRSHPDEFIEAAAVLDRLEHVLGAQADDLLRLIQPKAECLGEAFGAAPWAIKLFGEEVVRGTLAPVLSILARKAYVDLRRSFSLGLWRAINPGSAAGRLQFVEDLDRVQPQTFAVPTVILARRVTGNEDVPRAVTAVLSAKAVDVLAHLAIRTRNSRVPFAVCYDPEEFERLRRREGHHVAITVDPSGSVSVQPSTAEETAVLRAVPAALPAGLHPRFTAYAIPAAEFRAGLVGQKSLNTLRMLGRLPEWIRVPRSVAVPFGVLEKVLEDPRNRPAAARLDDLASRVGRDPRATLAAIRELVAGLEVPAGLLESLRGVLEEESLPLPADLTRAWSRIKHVWASKWTERAHLSRESNGIPADQVFMSVLVQQVVEAEYAFVIHTANPISGDRHELYAEVTPGLGETLTGGHPGAALGFVATKTHPEPRILYHPSKSVALYGGGLIFRSDSSAEDLPGYAGAGVHDSIMLDPPRQVLLDYLALPLLRDRDFTRSLLSSIARIGAVIEEVQGAPQDIEGAFSGGCYYVVQTRPQVGFVDD